MNIIVVDDEKSSLNVLRKILTKNFPDDEILCFDEIEEVIKFAAKNIVDVAFLDIIMPGSSGIKVAHALQQCNDKTNIIFQTAHQKYALDAFGLNASGYLLKPISEKKVLEEMNNLRYKTADSDKKIKIRCFGSFEIFTDGRPLTFSRKKCKEVIAYLVDRNGAMCSTNQIAAALWDDNSDHRSYLSKIRKNIIEDLKNNDCEELLLIDGSNLSINKDAVKCDYFDYLQGKPQALHLYNGEYMSDYWWADYTNGALYSQKFNF